MNPFRRWSKRDSPRNRPRRESLSLESPPSTHEILEREPSMVSPTPLTRPTEPSQIDALFRETIDKMALPKAAADRMWTLPLNQKWQIVQDWSKKSELERQHESEDRHPFYWIQKLQAVCLDATTSLSEEEARELHVLMRGGSKEWLHKFHRQGGVTVLCEYMAALAFRALETATADPGSDQSKAILLQCLQCYKTIMNNPFGMELLLGSTDHHVDILARCLDFSTYAHYDVTITVLEMLSVFCWHSERGQHAVLEAMAAYRRLHKERARYWGIVQCLRSTESVELQAACLTFINTIVSAGSRLEDRVIVRNDFLALDLLVVCHAIQAKLEAPSSLAFLPTMALSSSAKAFLKQLQVFEGLMRSDMEDAVVSDVDLTNLDAVFAKLTQWTARHGFADRFLHVLLALMGIPGEATMGSKMWELAEEAILQITSLQTFKDLEAAPRHLSYEWVRELQESVETFQHQVNRIATLESTIAALEAQAKRCHANVKTKESQIKELKDTLEFIRLEQLKHQSIICESTQTNVETAAGSVQTDPLHGCVAVETQTDQVVIEPHPPPQQESQEKPHPAEKYLKLMKMGMPREQVEMKMQRDGLDPKLLDEASSAASRSTQNAGSDASSATTPKQEENDPRVAKYLKLLKMGMPKEQVEMKMKAEGIDPALLESKAPAAAPVPVPQGEIEVVDPRLVKFMKLLKMGMPREQVMLKMQAEGLDPALLDAPSSSSQQSVPEATATSSTATSPQDPRLEKYLKLVKMGMPKEQVALKMKAEGLDPAMLSESSPAAPEASKAETSKAESPPVDPRAEKYIKLLKMGMPKEQILLKMKADGVDASLLDTSSQPSTTSIAGIAGSSAMAAYAKYVKLLKMGMPLEQVELKVKADGLDPSRLSQAPASGQPAVDSKAPEISGDTQKVSTGGGSSASKTPERTDASSNKAPPTPPVFKLPPKKSTPPNVKLRSLYWTQLPDAAMEGSVWLQMDESKLGLDLAILEKEYVQDTKKPSTEGQTQQQSPLSPPESAKAKPKVVHLVDGKRQQNCSIALSRFRMTPKDIRQAIVLLDEKILTLERIQSLAAMVPTGDEMELVKTYEGDVALLGETEKFFLAISDVPRLAERLKAMESSCMFSQRYDDVKTKLKLLDQAYLDLKNSDKLISVLEVILAVGNYLNGGTPRGGAYGFKLDILPKLVQVKSTASGTHPTLLHCIADFVMTRVPFASDFYDSLNSLNNVATISFTLLQSDFGVIEASLDQIAKEMPHQDSGFSLKMGGFLTTAQTDCTSLRDNLATFESKFHRLTLSFGVDTTKPSDTDAVQGFFTLWNDFCKAYKRAAHENQLAKEKATKQEKAKQVDTAKRDLFQQFTDCLEGDASDIVANYKSRHRTGGDMLKREASHRRKLSKTTSSLSDGPAT
ncbi:hypothetical protein AeMF1_012017 [Aphanomyces euteiches]|nr:hypothetical protein AeMF1_012017 [Aphanomyces euteiches]KAH9197029.1 hypothetical protein AeNC1_000980 [Aphanomyces euteiches]